MRVIFSRIIICILVVLLVIFVIVINRHKNYEIIQYKKTIASNNYMAHALGGVDGKTYLNSLESLNNSKKKGFKLFEVDIKLTSDNKIVCLHDWNQGGYKKLGIKYNKNNPIMSYEQFMDIKIQKEYTPIDFKTIIDFIKANNDVYFMIDIGSQNYEYTYNIYKRIVEYANKDEKILNHLIVGGHNTEMMKAVLENYDFKIKNLYWANKKNRKDKNIDTKEAFLYYCQKNKITSLSTSVSTFNEEESTIKYFRTNGLLVYVFTENSKQKAEEYLKYVDVVGTDFINLE